MTRQATRLRSSSALLWAWPCAALLAPTDARAGVGSGPPSPAVRIEARLVELPRDELERFGVVWGPSPDPFPSATIGSRQTPLLTSSFESGASRVLSAPRVTTRSGHAAVLQVGGDLPLGDRIHPGFGIDLRVTPQVTPDSRVLLEIALDVDRLTFDRGVAIIGSRRVDRKLVLGDGQAAVIAGLFQETPHDAVSRLPALGELPILGAFFRRRPSSPRGSLMLFVTPRLVGEGVGRPGRGRPAPVTQGSPRVDRPRPDPTLDAPNP